MTAVDSADRSQLFLLETLSVRCVALCAPTVLKEVCTHGFKEVCTHGFEGGVHPRYAGEEPGTDCHRNMPDPPFPDFLMASHDGLVTD